jgi:hypothetical protein
MALWLFVVVAVCPAVGACYALVERWTALLARLRPAPV